MFGGRSLGGPSWHGATPGDVDRAAAARRRTSAIASTGYAR